MSVIELVGELIIVKLMIVFGNGVVLGGLKVMMVNVWFVVCLLGIEDVYKIYVEFFCGL